MDGLRLPSRINHSPSVNHSNHSSDILIQPRSIVVIPRPLEDLELSLPKRHLNIPPSLQVWAG
jgi:hypothetical protein